MSRVDGDREKRVQEYIQPEYENDFRCIGSSCEDTCCIGWGVDIDKATYHKYESNPKLHPLLNHLVLYEPAQNEFKYAQIRLGESLRCPFLEADQLCQIQKQHGVDGLSRTCMQYPRMIKNMHGRSDKALALSCPEAARLVLLNPALVPAVREIGNDQGRYQQFSRLGDRAPEPSSEQEQFFWEIRSFTLLLLHDRSYPLWQRLFILGMFCRKLHEATIKKQFELVPGLLAGYGKIAAEGGLRLPMKEIPLQATAQLRAVVEVVRRFEELPVPGQMRIQECFEDFKRGIGFRPGAAAEEIVPAYVEACNRYYLPLMEQYPFIPENYLSNYIFRTGFPFGLNSKKEEVEPKTSFLMLCLHYTVVKGLLIGMAGYYRERFSTEHVVKLVQSFAKKAEHFPAVLDGVNGDLTSPISMAALLKN